MPTKPAAAFFIRVNSKKPNSDFTGERSMS